jgi:hypothetical protein
MVLVEQLAVKDKLFLRFIFSNEKLSEKIVHRSFVD